MLQTKFGQPVFTRLEAKKSTPLIMRRIVFTWLTRFPYFFKIALLAMDGLVVLDAVLRLYS